MHGQRRYRPFTVNSFDAFALSTAETLVRADPDLTFRILIDVADESIRKAVAVGEGAEFAGTVLNQAPALGSNPERVVARYGEAEDVVITKGRCVFPVVRHKP